jgi:hypothetical protein
VSPPKSSVLSAGYVAYAWTVLGALSMCIVVAGLRLAREQLSPTYSGFSSFRPALEAIPIAGATLVIAALVHAIAALARWPQALTKGNWLAMGALCGLWSAGYVARHWYWSLSLGGSIELPCIVGSLLIALWYRWRYATADA